MVGHHLKERRPVGNKSSSAKNLRAIEPHAVSPALAPRSFDINGRLESADGNLLARMVTVLQTSLDTAEILQLFGHELTANLPYDDLAFNRADARQASFDDSLHECRYQLTLMNRVLGEIVIRRHFPFSVAELEVLENLLCALIYPLRNALLYEEAVRTSLKDPVTGINNRTALDNYLEQRIAEHARYHHPLTVIMFDIDRFKDINDRYGHIAGDTVLAAVATQATNSTRSSDIVFRYGGEEFVVILSDTSLAGGCLLAERIRRAIEDLEIPAGDATLGVTVSIGVAEIVPDETKLKFIARVDEQLYAAKAAGRNVVYPAL